MSNPTVCCIMLANGRQEMVDRAVRSYLAQTYKAKHLFLLDTGDPLLTLPRMTVEDALEIYVDHARPRHDETIGALRNRANMWAKTLDCDIIAHFDSDDWSHPNRLTEQVALLQASGAECVGYNQALFWQDMQVVGRREILADAQEVFVDEQGRHCFRRRPFDVSVNFEGEAWFYTSPKSDVALGGTLCYWRRTWEAKRFLDLKFGEDSAWQTGMRVEAVPAFGYVEPPAGSLTKVSEPVARFIASIHGSNTSSRITPSAKDWRRAPEWDAHCEVIMSL